jgi:hypothetical protein
MTTTESFITVASRLVAGAGHTDAETALVQVEMIAAQSGKTTPQLLLDLAVALVHVKADLAAARRS